MRVIRTLIVDDSAFVRKVVREMLSGSPQIEVVGLARNGEEALEMVKRRKAYVREIIGPYGMPHPLVCSLKFKPVELRRFRGPPATHKIQIAIPIQIHQRRQAVISHAPFRRQIAIHEMM